jgi:hypothetical protein
MKQIIRVAAFRNLTKAPTGVQWVATNLFYNVKKIHANNKLQPTVLDVHRYKLFASNGVDPYRSYVKFSSAALPALHGLTSSTNRQLILQCFASPSPPPPSLLVLRGCFSTLNIIDFL